MYRIPSLETVLLTLWRRTVPLLPAFELLGKYRANPVNVLGYLWRRVLNLFLYHVINIYNY